MESFELWRTKVNELAEQEVNGSILFLAYNPISEADAKSAGYEFIGTTWDATGMPAKAYKATSGKALVYVCRTCGRTSKLDQGMYCCGKKRIRGS